MNLYTREEGGTKRQGLTWRSHSGIILALRRLSSCCPISSIKMMRPTLGELVARITCSVYHRHIVKHLPFIWINCEDLMIRIMKRQSYPGILISRITYHHKLVGSSLTYHIPHSRENHSQYFRLFSLELLTQSVLHNIKKIIQFIRTRYAGRQRVGLPSSSPGSDIFIALLDHRQEELPSWAGYL